MFKIDSPGTTAMLPAPAAAGETSGWFTEGDVETGVPATEVSADWLNAVQSELNGVVEGAGLTLDKTNSAQLLPAINRLISGLAGTNGGQATFSLQNNQSSAASITGLTLSNATARMARLFVCIYRKTDSAGELMAAGNFYFGYKPVAAQWLPLGGGLDGDDTGVEFTTTTGGQVQYTTSNLAGSNHVASIYFRVSYIAQ